MSGFKVGDRVRLRDTDIRELDGPLPGAAGTVVDANRHVPIVSWDGFTYKHASPGDDTTWVAVWAHELELLP